MNDKLTELKKDKDRWIEKRNYLRYKIKMYEDFENRSYCPCCEQKIDYKYYLNKLPFLNEELDIALEKIESLIKKIKKLTKPILEESERKAKEHNEKVKNYLTINKNKLNKAIRDYHKGIEHYLPLDITTKEEKEIWNEAMELQLDKRNVDENEELYYEL